MVATRSGASAKRDAEKPLFSLMPFSAVEDAVSGFTGLLFQRWYNM